MMAIPFSYIKHTPAGSAESTTIHDFTSYVVRRHMQAKTNTVELVMSNKFAKYARRVGTQSFFKEDDEVQVFANNNAIDENQHVLINMSVKEYNHSTDGKRIRLVGQDRTYQLLNKIYTSKGFDNGDNITADAAVKQIVAWVSSSKGTRQVSITTNNVTSTPTKKTGDPSGTATFSNVVMHLVNKTAYEWIQELSTFPKYTISGTKYTSNRNYIFWIDETEDMHWIYPAQTDPTGNMVIDVNSSSPRVISAAFTKSTFDVVNMIIYNAGTDPAGNGIQWYYYDETSKQPELRMKFIPMTDISTNQQANEKLLTAFTGEFPTSYPYTTSWNESVSSNATYTGGLTGGTFDYGNGTGKGSGFRGKARHDADIRSKAITSAAGDLRWKGKIVLKGTRDYSPGDFLKITYSDANMTNTNLRCVTVEHQFSQRGWFTTISLEEDEKTVTMGN